METDVHFSAAMRSLASLVDEEYSAVFDHAAELEQFREMYNYWCADPLPQPTVRAHSMAAEQHARMCCWHSRLRVCIECRCGARSTSWTKSVYKLKPQSPESLQSAMDKVRDWSLLLARNMKVRAQTRVVVAVF